MEKPSYVTPHACPCTHGHTRIRMRTWELTTQGCIRREGTSEAAPEAGGRLEEVAEAVGGGCCGST